MENVSDNQIAEEILGEESIEIDPSYECSICHSLFVKPVTLLCQHTYCRQCIKNHYDATKASKKTPTCPMCNCGIIIPPNDNNLLVDIINLNHSDQYKERIEESKKDVIKSEIKEDVKNELRRELFNSVMNDPPSFEEDSFYEKIKKWGKFFTTIEAFLGMMGIIVGMSYLKKFGINVPYIDNALYSLMYLWIICVTFMGGPLNLSRN